MEDILKTGEESINDIIRQFRELGLAPLLCSYDYNSNYLNDLNKLVKAIKEFEFICKSILNDFDYLLEGEGHDRLKRRIDFWEKKVASAKDEIITIFKETFEKIPAANDTNIYYESFIRIQFAENKKILMNEQIIKPFKIFCTDGRPTPKEARPYIPNNNKAVVYYPNNLVTIEELAIIFMYHSEQLILDLERIRQGLSPDAEINPFKLDTVSEKLLFLKYSGILDKVFEVCDRNFSQSAKFLEYLIDVPSGTIRPLLPNLNAELFKAKKHNPFTKKSVPSAINALTDLGIDTNALDNIYKKMIDR